MKTPNVNVCTKIAVGMAFFTVSAFANLIPSATQFEINMNGTGFGTVSTLITLQTADGQAGSEAGCIGFGNSTTGCGITTDGKIKNSSTTEPVPTGASAADLRFIFNAAQPQGGTITLTELSASFYNSAGDTVFTASLATAPMLLTSTEAGTGNSGFVFQLDGTEAAELQPLLGSVTAIGAGFSATGASGGQDTLFLGSANTAVPEPSSLALFGAGAALLLFGRLRRRV